MCMGGWVDEKTNGWGDGWVGRRVDGWRMDEWMDAWGADGWVDAGVE